MHKGIQAKSVDTIVLENVLRMTQVGDVVTYDSLSKALGRDVREFCYSNLRSACKTLIGESIFFDTVRGHGLRRLTDNEAADAGASFASKARRVAKRGLIHLASIDVSKLDPDHQKKHNITSAQLGAVEMFASSKAAKKIESRFKAASGPITIGETLKMFGGSAESQ